MGTVGAGKSTAIRAISDIEVVDTEVFASDDAAHLKASTTVSMDVGVLKLPTGDKLRLYGAPGQDRFDFMWDILLEHVQAVIVLVNHAAATPERDLAACLDEAARRLGQRKVPLAVGVTHFDQNPQRPMHIYDAVLREPPAVFLNPEVPVLRLDARERGEVRALVGAVTALLGAGGV